MRLKEALRPMICSAFVLAGLATLSAQASAASINLVQNGGFETGDLSSWIEVGNTGYSGVACDGALQGACEAYFGPVGSLGGIAQNITTTLGGQYSISFVFESDGGTPGAFAVDFGGQTLLSLTNPPYAGVQMFTFTAVATTSNSLLQFQFQDDPGLMYLDAVQVAALPEPGSFALAGLGLLGLAFGRQRKAR